MGIRQGFCKIRNDGRRTRYWWKRRNWKSVRKVRAVDPLIRDVRSVCQSN